MIKLRDILHEAINNALPADNIQEIRINRPKTNTITVTYNGDLPVNTVDDLREFMTRPERQGNEQIHTSEKDEEGNFQGLTVDVFGHIITPRGFTFADEYAQINFIKGIGFELELFFGEHPAGLQNAKEIVAQLTSMGWKFETSHQNPHRIDSQSFPVVGVKIHPVKNKGKTILYNGEKLI